MKAQTLILLYTLAVTFSLISAEPFYLRDLTTAPTTGNNAAEPTNSLGAMTTVYTPKGTVSTINDLPIYTVGTSTKNAIIYIYDIYGFNGGRTREICDRLASNGYFVILPDFFRGNFRDKKNPDGSAAFVMSDWTWEKAEKELTTNVYPYLEARGIAKWSLVGVCWGGYIAFKASTSSKVICAAHFHPALGAGAPATPEEIADKVIVPQLVIASSGEPASMQAGGSVETLLKAKPFGTKNVFKSYAQSHGFVSRGDLTNVETAKAVEESLVAAINFIKANNPPLQTANGFTLVVRLGMILGFLLVLF